MILPSLYFCNEASIYDISDNQTIIFGQHHYKFNKVVIKNIEDSKIILEFSRNCWNGWKSTTKFKLILSGKITFIENIKFCNGSKYIEANNVNLSFPFENHNLSLNKNSAIITTMCKHYRHRLDEWINYNINLGFSAIIVFDNDKNLKNTINEKAGARVQSTKDICDKYKDKVLCIEFEYPPLGNDHWNTLQMLSLSIGVGGFKNYCKYIALIDPDEFIYLPREKDNNIEEFLSNYNISIKFKSNILTNKSSSDRIDNNVLKVCKYVGMDKYPKAIIYTNHVKGYEFFFTPHHFHTEIVLEKDVLIHYHCWINNREQWKPNMTYFDKLA